MYTNADQLTSLKKSELRELITQHKPHIIAICEVKPKNGAERTLQDYTMNGYVLHHTNIDSNVGRGIAIYVHSSIANLISQINTTPFREACILEIYLQGTDTMVFGCFYRSPSLNSASDENNDNLNAVLKNLALNKKYSHKCFVGDFNFNSINWNTCSSSHNEESKEEKFLETIRDCFLFQHVLEPTRCRGTDDPSTIDLIFTDEENQITDLQYQAPLGKSDHSVITFTFNCYVDLLPPTKKLQYDKADFQSMKRHLCEVGWSNGFNNENTNKPVNDLWFAFKTKILELRDQFVPVKLSGLPSWKDKGKVPINQDLWKEIKEKKRLHRKWVRSKHQPNNHLIHESYKRVRNRVKKLMLRGKKDFEKKIGSDANRNPKRFWAHIRSKLKSRTGVAPLRQKDTDKSSLRFSDKDKANILQQQFCSVFTREPEGSIPNFDVKSQQNINDLQITEDMVRKEIIGICIHKAFGPDEIHPSMLKELIDHVTGPLTFIFNKTISDGCLPDDWKKASVSPIYKKGAKYIPANYRPISLTSIVCKLMESILKKSIMEHLNHEDLLSSKQFGFINKRSTTTQLLSFLEKCIDSIADGGVVDTIYFDFAKAFDTVPHRRLLSKLASYGIRGNILRWIKSFLEDRSQIVKVNGTASTSETVISGIPQGSVLGPILFVIYINDLPDELQSHVYLFADDTKIFRCIKSKEDSLTVQTDIQALESWSEKWLLKFHPDKCHVLSLGKLENIVHAHPYVLNGHELEHVFAEKDLGVTIDCDLKFEDHIAIKIKKANSLVGLITRSFSYMDCELFKQLYTTFVRPHLEYAHVVWSPHLRKQINQLESVQRRATKLVYDLKNLSYQERLKKLKLPTLAHRRSQGDMIEVYKHLHIHDNNIVPQKLRLRERPSRGKHDYQILPNFPKDGVRGVQRNSFYFRVSTLWNNLPNDVVNAPTLDTFKRSLERAWTDIPSKYDPNL